MVLASTDNFRLCSFAIFTESGIKSMPISYGLQIEKKSENHPGTYYGIGSFKYDLHEEVVRFEAYDSREFFDFISEYSSELIFLANYAYMQLNSLPEEVFYA